MPTTSGCESSCGVGGCEQVAVQVAWAKSTSGATLALGPKSTTVAVRVAVQVAFLEVYELVCSPEGA